MSKPLLFLLEQARTGNWSPRDILAAANELGLGAQKLFLGLASNDGAQAEQVCLYCDEGGGWWIFGPAIPASWIGTSGYQVLERVSLADIRRDGRT